jgi:hypothetical protein
LDDDQTIRRSLGNISKRGKTPFSRYTGLRAVPRSATLVTDVRVINCAPTKLQLYGILNEGRTQTVILLFSPLTISSKLQFCLQFYKGVKRGPDIKGRT